MNALGRWLMLGSVVILLGAGRGEALELGRPAPGFAATDVKGNPIALDDYKGAKHVVVVFYIGYA